MPGVSWSQRSPTDWLASNGRWYEASTRPRDWSTSALPPAPGHGGIGSILGRIAEAGSTAAGLGSSNDEPSVVRRRPTGPGSPKPPPRPSAPAPAKPGSSVRPAPTGRRVAEATITETYEQQNPAIPPPPGRLRPEETPEVALPAPPAPKESTIPPPSPGAAGAEAGSFEVVAGDLGRVLGTAKRRIEKAINDSAES